MYGFRGRVHDDRRGLAAAGELEAERLHFSHTLKQRKQAEGEGMLQTQHLPLSHAYASSSKTPTLKDSKLSQTALPVCPVDELHHGSHHHSMCVWLCTHVQVPSVQKRVKYEEKYSILCCEIIYWDWELHLAPLCVLGKCLLPK